MKWLRITSYEYSLGRTPSGVKSFKEVQNTLIEYSLKQNPLRCVLTDDGKNMCGTEKGLFIT